MRDLLAVVRTAYDWGVHLADRDLGETLALLREEGWLDAASIVAVTSDHGEFLGERGLLDHGRSVARDTKAVRRMRMAQPLM